jgi:hypothetical protein
MRTSGEHDAGSNKHDPLKPRAYHLQIDHGLSLSPKFMNRACDFSCGGNPKRNGMHRTCIGDTDWGKYGLMKYKRNQSDLAKHLDPLFGASAAAWEICIPPQWAYGADYA